ASMVGTDTRTMSAPASTTRLIWATVAATSQVSVLVMVCTAMGASPPTGTLPTWIWRDWRRRIGDSYFIRTSRNGAARSAATDDQARGARAVGYVDVHRAAVVGHLDTGCEA